MPYRKLLAAVIVVVLYGCSSKQQATVFTELTNTNIDFVNQIKETDKFNVFKYRNFYNGGGVAAGDLNNDGLTDLFFTANQGANKLYLNKGDLKFEDISQQAGFDPNKKHWSTGVVLVDINADGWLDIYVCNAGNMIDKPLRKNQLFINNRNLTFTESAAVYGLDNDGYTTHASFFDYDLDGDLDCFMVNNSPIPVNTLNYANMRNQPDSTAPVADFLKGGGDHLYRNDNGKYKEVTYQSGIHGSLIGFGLGVTVGDVNQDGYPDIYVSNDFFERDYLYINQRNGQFVDEIESRMQHLSLSSMGADIHDINNDGKLDIFTTDMLPGDDYRLKTNTSFEGYDVVKIKENQGFYNQYTQNTLQVNVGNGRFVETGFYSGVAASDWSWGALMFDADNDSKSDILVCNGIYRDVTDQDFIDFFANDVIQDMVVKGKREEVGNVIDKMPSVPIPNKFFRNTGNAKFEDVGDAWGLNKKTFSNGAVYADLDNDGDLDVVINNVNQKALVYKNNSREQSAISNNYVAIQLAYTGANNFGIGSTISIFSGKEKITREIMPARGFQSSVEYRQTIGVGTNKIDSAEIIWPNGDITRFTPKVNGLTTIDYNAVSKNKKQQSPSATVTPLFTVVASSFDQHKEDSYVDFYNERNIPFMLSKQGPKAAVGDVNGDGIEDLFIGGAFQQPSQLYLQKAGRFVKKDIPDFKKFTFNDVTAAFFFDADKDGDNDLFIGGGGNMAPAASGAYQHQYYVNDGKGNFALQPGTFGMGLTNCGVAIPFDYDEDGFLDVFVGSRSEPQQYGISPKSFIFHNNKRGGFEPLAENAMAGISTIGMVTSAMYADINGDTKKELVVTGDYMGVQAWQFNRSKFEPVVTELENTYGWWQAMKLHDVDGDGDLDMVLGNIGENFYLQPTEDKPVKVWIKDFDQNGTIDKVFTRVVNGKDVPVFLKKDLTDQLPSLKKGNLKHVEFAAKSIQELFGKEIESADVKKITRGSSVIAYNNGKGKFTIVQLPIEAQWSSIYALYIKDVNGDGKPDIVAAGNQIDVLPQFCRIDGNYGTVLVNRGNKVFEVMPQPATGLLLRGQVRDIAEIEVNKQKQMLVLQNNNVPLLYTSQTSSKQVKK